MQDYLAQGIISIPDDFVSINLWYKGGNSDIAIEM
jgi:hypothetical protein